MTFDDFISYESQPTNTPGVNRQVLITKPDAPAEVVAAVNFAREQSSYFGYNLNQYTVAKSYLGAAWSYTPAGPAFAPVNAVTAGEQAGFGFGPLADTPDSDISVALGVGSPSTAAAAGIGSGQPQPIGVVTPASGSTFAGGTGVQSVASGPAESLTDDPIDSGKPYTPPGTKVTFGGVLDPLAPVVGTGPANPAAPAAEPADAGSLLRVGLTVAGYFLFR